MSRHSTVSRGQIYWLVKTSCLPTIVCQGSQLCKSALKVQTHWIMDSLKIYFSHMEGCRDTHSKQFLQNVLLIQFVLCKAVWPLLDERFLYMANLSSSTNLTLSDFYKLSCPVLRFTETSGLYVSQYYVSSLQRGFYSALVSKQVHMAKLERGSTALVL